MHLHRQQTARQRTNTSLSNGSSWCCRSRRHGYETDEVAVTFFDVFTAPVSIARLREFEYAERTMQSAMYYSTLNSENPINDSSDHTESDRDDDDIGHGPGNANATRKQHGVNPTAPAGTTTSAATVELSESSSEVDSELRAEALRIARAQFHSRYSKQTTQHTAALTAVGVDSRNIKANEGGLRHDSTIQNSNGHVAQHAHMRTHTRERDKRDAKPRRQTATQQRDRHSTAFGDTDSDDDNAGQQTRANQSSNRRGRAAASGANHSRRGDRERTRSRHRDSATVVAPHRSREQQQRPRNKSKHSSTEAVWFDEDN